MTFRDKQVAFYLATFDLETENSERADDDEICLSIGLSQMPG